MQSAFIKRLQFCEEGRGSTQYWAHNKLSMNICWMDILIRDGDELYKCMDGSDGSAMREQDRTWEALDPWSRFRR